MLLDCPMERSEASSDFSPVPTIIPEWVYYVHVCGFTFRFWSVKQIQACLDFYSLKLNPSSRMEINLNFHEELDHSRLQTWYSRLPMYLRKENKRQQVVKALEKAMKSFGDDPSLLPSPRDRVPQWVRERDLSDIDYILNHSLWKFHLIWCSKCGKRLGQGFCLKCERRRSHSMYRVPANCNSCKLPLGEGDCKICQNVRSRLITVVDLLIAIAIKEGHIDSELDPVAKYIPEWSKDERSKVTLQDLMYMQSGLRNEDKTDSLTSDLVQMYAGSDTNAVDFQIPAIKSPGKACDYNHANTQILREVLEKATGKKFIDY
jgi:Beta-lactamase